MAVAFDAISTGAATNAAAPTTIDLTTMTVGSGSNRALVVLLTLLNQTSTGITVTWDAGGSNQTMELIGSAARTGPSTTAYLYGLVNPVSGNKTLTASWTTGNNVAIDAISFTGVNQTGGATSFPNFNSAQTTGTAASVDITTNTSSYVVGSAVAVSVNMSSMDHTTIHVDNGAFGFGGNYSAGDSGSTTLGGTLASSSGWLMIGTSIAPVPEDKLIGQIWM